MTNKYIKENLTHEEVQSLPVGSKVFIEWSGGNSGEYIIYETPTGEKICNPYNENHGWFYGQIDFIGTESYHTKVHLIK